jgi:hypothetical protein
MASDEGMGSMHDKVANYPRRKVNKGGKGGAENFSIIGGKGIPDPKNNKEIIFKAL